MMKKKENKLILSPLPHTWIFDLDGSIVKHNGYKNGNDVLLPSVKEFFENDLPAGDFVIIVTSREEKCKKSVIKFLKNNKIRFNHIIFGLPYGERILINDKKPSNLITSYAINLKRDEFDISFEIDDTL